MCRHHPLLAPETLGGRAWQKSGYRWDGWSWPHGSQTGARFGSGSNRSESALKKKEDGKRLGADHFYATSDPETFTKLQRSFDLIINTVSAEMDWNEYINLLKVDGALVVVGIPEKQIPIGAMPLAMGRRSLAGSAIGGIKETQEMLDFCGSHKITSDIEVIPIQQVNEAYERVQKSDVRYRFVIDMASLKGN